MSLTRSNIENIIGGDVTLTCEDEFSYIEAAGEKLKDSSLSNTQALDKMLGHPHTHVRVDRRFVKDDIVILVELKQANFTKGNVEQLAAYVECEKRVMKSNKIVAILLNTKTEKARVWINDVPKNEQTNEKKLKSFDHYKKYFEVNGMVNDKETVMRNTYALNEHLHKIDIPENLRCQLVGSCLLYIQDLMARKNYTVLDQDTKSEMEKDWKSTRPEIILAEIKSVIKDKLIYSDNQEKKINILSNNVFKNQKVNALTSEQWTELLSKILMDIYKYVDPRNSEGQDILHLFFIAFNKYVAKDDKNQAFTPDHITNFMCKLTGVNRDSVVLDATCGSGSFLVQSFVREYDDCKHSPLNDKQRESCYDDIRASHIYGIEVEEKAYGLAVTNFMMHDIESDNLKLANVFDCADFIQSVNPSVILFNPPYNAKPMSIPDKYKADWNKKQRDGYDDPTKGLVFVKFISDVIKDMNKKREEIHEARKEVKMAVLLPVACAIGSKEQMKSIKRDLLEENTLEGVFTLPDGVFQPGAATNVCCMVFTLGRPHNENEIPTESFFGYCKDDGFKLQKKLGRMEQFDKDGKSIWKETEKRWLSNFKNKKVLEGESAMQVVSGDDEWLCEAYMATDYSTLSESDFEDTVNTFIAHKIKEGNVYED